MKIIDKEGKLGGKINIIDALVLLVILAVLAAGIFKLTNVNPQVTDQEKDMRIQIKVVGVQNATVDAIHENDVVKDYDSNLVFGTIVEKKVEPSIQYLKTDDGKYVKATVPEKYDMFLTFAVKGTVNENAITVAHQEMRIGGKVTIKTNIYAVNGRIFFIKIDE